jgi:hypothetical protein
MSCHRHLQQTLLTNRGLVRAGMYRALPVRPNPRLRICNSVLRTYIDVMHVSINQKDIIFKGSAALAPIPDDDEMPGTPASAVGSESGSQVCLASGPPGVAVAPLQRRVASREPAACAFLSAALHHTEWCQRRCCALRRVCCGYRRPASTSV